MIHISHYLLVAGTLSIKLAILSFMLSHAKDIIGIDRPYKLFIQRLIQINNAVLVFNSLITEMERNYHKTFVVD